LEATPVDDGFIHREPGLDYMPLAFTRLDLKLIWA